MSGIIEQLKKDILELLIMKLLSERDMCGHEIVEVIKEKSDGYIKLMENNIYPILYRLVGQGVIDNYWDRVSLEKTIPRRYYTITEKGRKILRNQLDQWDLFLKGSLSILSESSEGK